MCVYKIRGTGIWGVLILLLMIVGLPLQAANERLEEPQRVVARVSEEVMAVLESDLDRIKTDPTYVYQLARDILLPHVDFEMVSSLVLGKSWRRATPEQREEFSYQFQRLLVRTYSTAFNEFVGDWKIRYLPLQRNKKGNRVQVRTQVLRTGAQPVDVAYRMHLKDGKWLAYDVQIEGFSLVTNYRSSFAEEVRRNGIDSLIARITRLNDTRVQKAAPDEEETQRGS